MALNLGGEFMEGLEEFLAVLIAAMGSTEMAVSLLFLALTIFVLLLSAAVTILGMLLVCILEMIPLYKIYKKLGIENVWLVWLGWLPVVGRFFRMYALEEIPGRKPLHLVGKLRIEDRMQSFWIYVGIAVFGSALASAIIAILNSIPLIAMMAYSLILTLYLAPQAAMAWMEYAYLRDVLDIFKEDHRSNIITAAVVAALDSLVTMGLVRPLVLISIMNEDPLQDRLQETR